MKNSHKRHGAANAIVVGIIFIIVGVFVLALQYLSTDFALKQGLTTPLERVANASNVQTAYDNTNEAIKYLETNRMVDGNSSYFLNDRANDVGYFYQNLQKARTELDIARKNKNPTQLEESNLLIRIKEVVIHRDGTTAVPAHLAYYPNLWGNLLLQIFGWAIGVIGCICFRVGMDD